MHAVNDRAWLGTLVFVLNSSGVTRQARKLLITVTQDPCHHEVLEFFVIKFWPAHICQLGSLTLAYASPPW